MNRSTPPSSGRTMNIESKTLHEEAEAPRKPNVFDPGNLSQLLNWNPFEKCTHSADGKPVACPKLEPEAEKEMLLMLAYRFVLTSLFGK